MWYSRLKRKVRTRRISERDRHKPPDTNEYGSSGSKKTGPKAAPKDGPATPAADRVAGEVKNLKIDDTPKASSKHLDVLKEYENSKSKRSATFVVVGKFPLSGTLE